MKYFLIGFMGSGKTHWGQRWAALNKMAFYDLDQEIEKTLGESVADTFEKKGEDFFREMERYVLRKFDVADNFIMACGGGTPCFFDNMQWMKSNGIVIYLQVSPPKVFERVMDEKDKRPLIKKLNTSELLFFIEQKIKEREAYYSQAHHTLDDAAVNENSFKAITSLYDKS
jgi:shikimate kinase